MATVMAMATRLVRFPPLKKLPAAWCVRSLKSQSKPVEIVPNIDKIRNIGIMAHVDAGKTTTTERMLYYSGFISSMGNVDRGDTAMDYLKQEQERGITINAASVSIPWNGFQMNIIDTPGHVDFTFEVERSLRVLDGAVILIDGSTGVESQTISVWHQTQRYGLPRILFVNKMDHFKASLTSTLDSVKKKLNANCLLVQVPLKTESGFVGIVDIVSMNALLWDSSAGDDGSEYWTHSLRCLSNTTSNEMLRDDFIEGNLDSKLGEAFLGEVFDYRAQLVDELAMTDNTVYNLLLNENQSVLQIHPDVLKASIRKATLQCAGFPVLFGSALKNKGIQPLLNAVVDYLPSPCQQSLDIPDELKDLFAYAFKVTHSPQRGALVHLRIYSGSIKPHSSVYNVTQRKRENVTRVLLALADEYKEVNLMGNGNIAVAVGLKWTSTGDTVVSRPPSTHIADVEDVLKNPVVPDPMFFCTFEPLSAVHQSALDNALTCLRREDPSIGVTNDEETGQRIVSGLGELHLEVIHQRLKDEYKVDANIGKLQVAYREAPTNSITITESFSARVGNKTCSMDISLIINPSDQPQTKINFPVATHVTLPFNISKDDLIAAISNGIHTSLLRGPLLSYPVSQVHIAIESVLVGSGTTLAWISSTVSDCMSKAFCEADFSLLEPVVKAEVLVREEHLQTVLGDLSSNRRAIIESVEDEGGVKRVLSLLPVASLTGYASDLRNMTSGMATFSTRFSHYVPVSSAMMNDISNKLKHH